MVNDSCEMHLYLHRIEGLEYFFVLSLHASAWSMDFVFPVCCYSLDVTTIMVMCLSSVLWKYRHHASF